MGRAHVIFPGMSFLFKRMIGRQILLFTLEYLADVLSEMNVVNLSLKGIVQCTWQSIPPGLSWKI